MFLKKLETASCPLCKSKKHSIIHKFNPFCSVKCSCCGMFYLSPRLSEEEIKKLYCSNNYFQEYSGTEQDYTSQQKSLEKTFKKLINNMNKQNLTGGKLLEIGCAYGLLLKQAKPFFNYVAGTDFSQQALEKSKIYADKVWHGGIDEIDKDTEKFDIIVLSNVIEHIYDPVNFMKKVYSLLAPGGSAIIATPKFGGFWSFIFGKNWPSYKVPEHVSFFTPKHLKQLCLKANFNKVENIKFPHYFPINVIFSKLNISLPKFLNITDILIPDVITAVVAQKGQN